MRQRQQLTHNAVAESGARTGPGTRTGTGSGTRPGASAGTNARTTSGASGARDVYDFAVESSVTAGSDRNGDSDDGSAKRGDHD